jgi:hypothetical protein
MIAIALAATSTALAQEDSGEAIETLDLTMELMSEGATTPEAVTRIIELPEAVLEAARERAANGLDEANANRERRDEGLAIADEAREAGRERAEQAQEDAGRGQPPETGPPPDIPGPPGNGGPPQSPGN